MKLSRAMVHFDGDTSTDGSLATDETELSPALRPKVLDPDGLRRRAAIHAALFGEDEAAPQLGRFRLLEHLGAGGMGTVYAAYDDQLDRKIAIKIIHTRQRDPAQRERSLREARALARLSHPNVVHVYEVGEVDGQLFVAMEFLAGPTLRAWLDDGTVRSWRETLAVFREAGAGLAAAHASGIIHRDFKPHNAMFGADGRVRVLDFGLARFDELASEAEAEAGLAPADSGEVALTMTGAIMGTPAYMAPEQIGGREVSALSDQFAFCVALFEALYHTRPFLGRTLTQLREALITGAIEARPRDTQVPRWVHAILLRGLAREPSQRWPSIDALLEALARDPAVVRRRRLLAALPVVALASALIAPLLGTDDRLTESCPDSSEDITPVWSDAQVDTIHASLSAKYGAHADAVIALAKPRLDRYAEAWVEMRNEACQTHASGHQSNHVFDARTICLDQSLRSLIDVVHGLHEVAPVELDSLDARLDDLPGIQRCADINGLISPTPPPVETRQWILHEVIQGDTLESIARRYGSSETSIASANDLRRGAPLEPGNKLRVHADRVPLPPQRLFYTTQPEDTWAGVAARFGIPESALRAFNPGAEGELAPEQLLLVLIVPEPPEPRLDLDLDPAPPPGYEQARSVGTMPGRLEHGVQLPEDERLYTRRAPQLMWTNGVVAKHLPAAVAELRTRFGFRGTLVISDISRPEGGNFPPHASHQNGRDVDIWLPMLEGAFDPERLFAGRPTPEEIDWFGLYGLLIALQETGKVESIYLASELQEKVHAAGKLMGASDEELAHLLSWPLPNNVDPDASEALVRHAAQYREELHVRFAAQL